MTGTKNVLGTIHLLNNTNLQTNDLNGVDLSALWADAVLVDVEQKINGTVVFQDNVVFDGLSFDGTIDGVSDWEIKNWMLKDEPQIVEGSSVFRNGFKAKDLTLDTVNNFDLKFLESNIVKVNEASEITGPVIFQKSILSTGNVGVTGKIQGIKLSEEAILKGDVLSVSGEKTFSQDVIIEGPLTVDGLINNIDIEDFCSKAFVKNEDINVTRLIIKGDVIIEEGTIEGNLAGVELQILKDAAVRDDGSTIKFSGLKNFKSLTFEGVSILFFFFLPKTLPINGLHKCSKEGKIFFFSNCNITKYALGIFSPPLCTFTTNNAAKIRRAFFFILLQFLTK